jgi:uracil-DNA glycosylase family 4
MSSSGNALAQLAWLVEAGADEAMGDEPVNRFAKTSASQNPSPPTGEGGHRSAQRNDDREGGRSQPPSPSHFASRPLPQGEGGKQASILAPVSSGSDLIGHAMEIAARCNSLAELKSALENFEGSALKKLATNTVFADGTPDQRIMFIGEAPGRDEDRIGLPFVGRAGKLLDLMLASINLDRRKNVYITNVLNWRPPDNRDPSPEEAAICLPFLRRHIELVSPGIIVLLGAVAARHVMGKTDGIMRLRGKWLEYYVNDQMVPVMPTLHPAYLLRRAIDKKLAWRDLQVIEEKIRSLKLLDAG